MRRLPFEKVRLLGEAMVRGQKDGSIHAEIDPVLIVFSAVGLVMLHMATLKFFAETFHRPVPDQGRDLPPYYRSAVARPGAEADQPARSGVRAKK